MGGFNWTERNWSARWKERFHSMGRARLRKLADELGLEKGTFDVRSNQGGPAVSGEVTLHHDKVYVQISRPATGSDDRGVMMRTCEGRRDYTGGRNVFAPLSLLDDVPALAERVRCVQPALAPAEEEILAHPPGSWTP